jgi:hypothetical protein
VPLETEERGGKCGIYQVTCIFPCCCANLLIYYFSQIFGNNNPQGSQLVGRQNGVKQLLIDAKLKTGKRGKQKQLTSGSPLGGEGPRP